MYGNYDTVSSFVDMRHACVSGHGRMIPAPDARNHVPKTRLPYIAFMAAAVLALAACSSDPVPSDPDGSSANDAATVAAVIWTDGVDGVPTLTFDQPFVVSGASARLVADGDGETLTDGQIVSLDYVMFQGEDGSVAFSTYDTVPEAVQLDSQLLFPELYDILVRARVGAQIIYGTPDNAAEPVRGVARSIVMAVTVVGVSTVLDRAEGEAVEPPAGLPPVTLAENGAPSIVLPVTEKPAGLVVQPLIIGEGAVVAEGVALSVHYSGWLWDGTLFDSSWDRGEPATFGFARGSLIDGWVDGLSGQTVGSQVLLIIPPELGYGDADQGTIPPGSTLVFVVDILAAQ